jgi:acyl-coenzyme A thioesterase PaaI-like protein
MTTRRPGQREGPAGTERQLVRVAHADRESWRTRLWRWGLNFFPAYRGTGGRVTFIAADWSEVRVTIPLNWRTRNYVKTTFGGSMYGAVDPIYMFMLIKLLGPEYVVWDKTAAIRFRRPGRERLFARFVVTAEDLEEIRTGVAAAGKYEKSYTVHLTSRPGEVHAIIEKGIHISRRT